MATASMATASMATENSLIDPSKTLLLLWPAEPSLGLVHTATGPPASSETVLCSTSTDDVGIEQWIEFDDGYASAYISFKKWNIIVLVKYLAKGDKLVLNFSGVDPPIYHLGDGDRRPGPGAGMDPTREIFEGGSMQVGPNDPIWLGGGIGGDQSGFPYGFGGGIIGDQPGFPGAPGVPPGARFDPYGPPGVPGFEPNRFSRFPRWPGGGTHPDVEQPGRDNVI